MTLRYCLMDLPATMPFANAVESFVADAAQWMKDKILEATMRQRVAYAQAGNILPGKTVPFGWQYVTDPTKLTKTGRPVKIGFIPDVVNGPALLHMYQHIAGGGSSGALKRWLEDHNFKTPQGAAVWNEGSIARILQNSTNWGERMSFRTRNIPHPLGVLRDSDHRSSRVQVRVPIEQQIPVDPARIVLIPGLTKDLAMRALARMAENEAFSARRATASEEERAERALLFGGLVRCSVCGGGMRVKCREANWIYCCFHDRTPHHAERSMNISAKKLDGFVWAVALRSVRDPAFLEELVTVTDTLSAPAIRAGHLERTLAEHERERDNLLKYLRKLDPDNDANQRAIASYETELRQVLDRIADTSATLSAVQVQVQAEEARRASLAAFRAFAAREQEGADAKTPIERRQMLRALRGRVRVQPVDVFPRLWGWLTPSATEKPSGWVDFGEGGMFNARVQTLQSEGALAFTMVNESVPGSLSRSNSRAGRGYTGGRAP